MPQLRPGLVSTHVLVMVSAKRSLNAKVDLPFDGFYAYFCTYAFQPSPNAYWDGNLSPITLSPNHYPDTQSALYDLIALQNIFHSIAHTHFSVQSVQRVPYC